MLKTDYLDTGS